MVKKKTKRKEVKAAKKFNPGTQKYEVDLPKESVGVTKKMKNRENHQLSWFFAAIVLVFVVFLGVFFYAQSLKKFDYAGVPFNEVHEFNMKFYHGRFPIPKIYWDGEQKYYNFWLRNDPRENHIPMDFVVVNDKIIISIDSSTSNCEEGGIAYAELSKFLGAFNKIELEGAFTDEDIARAANITYATCEQANQSQTVLIYQKSDSPSIVQSDENENCYYLNVGECENLKTIERFILGSIAQINKIDLN